MSNVPISGLPTASSLLAGDIVPVVNGGTTKSTSLALLVSATVREATVANVACDGTATPITFSSAFPNTVGVVKGISFSNYSGSDNATFSHRISVGPSLTGFTIVIGGGQSGSTVTLHYSVRGT